MGFRLSSTYFIIETIFVSDANEAVQQFDELEKKCELQENLVEEVSSYASKVYMRTLAVGHNSVHQIRCTTCVTEVQIIYRFIACQSRCDKTD